MLPDASWKQHEVRRRQILTKHQGEFEIRGKRSRGSLPQANRGRAACIPGEDRVFATSGFAGLGEQQNLAVFRDVGRHSPILPAEIALLVFSRCEADRARPHCVSGDKSAASGTGIVKRQSPRSAEQLALCAGEGDPPQRSAKAGGGSGKPDFIR